MTRPSLPHQPPRHPFIRLSAILTIVMLTLASAHAKWVEQTVTLRPGWNAIWLEVTPEANEIETVFQGIPVTAVWRHHAEETSARYIDDSSAFGRKPDPERWLTWIPGQASGSVLKTLHRVHGGNAYLVQLDGGSNVTWTVTGRPVVSDHSWLSASYSISGLCVDPVSPVTFAQFFSGSAAHTGSGSDIRRIQPDGTWVSIPASTPIQRGEAYWILSKGISAFQGRGSVEVDDSGLLDFGSSIVEHSIILANNTPTIGSFSLGIAPASPPAGAAHAGPVLLSILTDAGPGTTPDWEILDNPKTLTVPANSKRQVRLAIRRTEMIGQGDSQPFHSILQVTGMQSCTRIGIVADGFAPGTSSPARYAGLWVGQCVIDKVNQPAAANPDALQPTPTEASLRILVRVNENGTVELLREAYIFWLDGITDAGGNLTEPGRFLVAGSDAEIAQLQVTYGPVGTGRLKGSAMRDGVNVPRRISTAGFSFTDPLPLSGSFNPLSGNLNATVTIGYNDDLNPYKHRYHPDHDNLVDGSAAKNSPTLLPEGRESYTINRQITLSFENTDPEDLRLSGWGDNLAGGSYQETVTGLHRHPVKAAGSFRLTRVVTF